jgi:flagellar biosynthesis protein FliR
MGPFTYADDLRHIGELSAMIGFFISGVCILIANFYPQSNTALKLHWIAGTILLGLLVGTILDLTFYCMLLSIPIGLLVGYWRRDREKVNTS